MIYCKKCLSTDLRPNSLFKDGVCIPCSYSETSFEDVSSSKLERLKTLIEHSRQKQRHKGSYDCIVGVSGGKDSTRQAHWVRDRLGLRPLIVCCAYPPKQMSDIGAENLSNLMEMGFDIIMATPSPKTAAQLSLEGFVQFGNLCKSTEMSLFSTVPRLAIELGVNTIFWGENSSLQIGDAAVEGVDEFDGNNLRQANTLKEGGTDWIKNNVSKEYMLNHYVYPDEIEFEKNKIKIFYLGPAWDDWSNENNSTYAALQGLTLRPGEEKDTGDLSNASMLDEDFSNINMMLKYFKFGFGRATDNLNEKIRNKIITREQAIKIAEEYDGCCSEEIIRNYTEYVGISIYEFWDIANKWVNKDIFEIRSGSRPVRKFIVGINYEG